MLNLTLPKIESYWLTFLTKKDFLQRSFHLHWNLSLPALHQSLNLSWMQDVQQREHWHRLLGPKIPEDHLQCSILNSILIYCVWGKVFNSAGKECSLSNRYSYISCGLQKLWLVHLVHWVGIEHWEICLLTLPVPRTRIGTSWKESYSLLLIRSLDTFGFGFSIRCFGNQNHNHYH